ncbi:MAG TPA: DUF58 domain-containing protein [Methylophilaceae bacterium]|nr:DUF58 domain-containing protein [Methylophilaceae bacterium]
MNRQPSGKNLLHWKSWLRVVRRDNAPAELTARHIYILPTRYGVLYALVLLAMLTGSINYTLSLGFVLTFLLAGMGMVAMLHTWRNLAHLRIESRRTEPVFAGEDALFEIAAIDHKLRSRHAIAAHFTGTEPAYADIAANAETIFKLALPTSKRGWLMLPRITFFTEFPLSLFHAWSYVELGSSSLQRCLVYPQPAPYGIPVPSASDPGAAGALDASKGDDDFAGHRAYQLGDSPKRVDWKASSREQGLLTKQFSGEAQATLWLDWFSTPGADAEQRIGQLTRWVIDAHANRQRYGLRLPQQAFAPDSGEAHYRRCLQALALMD